MKGSFGQIRIITSVRLPVTKESWYFELGFRLRLKVFSCKFRRYIASWLKSVRDLGKYTTKSWSPISFPQQVAANCNMAVIHALTFLSYNAALWGAKVDMMKIYVKLCLVFMSFSLPTGKMKIDQALFSFADWMQKIKYMKLVEARSFSVSNSCTPFTALLFFFTPTDHVKLLHLLLVEQ